MQIDLTPEELTVLRAALAEYTACCNLGAELAEGRAPLARARHLREAVAAQRLLARIGDRTPVPAA